MKSSHPWPPSGRKEGLTDIIGEIVKLVHPEKIFLTGSTYEFRLTENIFIKNPVKDFICSRYDLLIISDKQENITDTERELLLYARFSHHPGLHIRLMDIHAFNQSVREGKEFENFILLNAFLCYDNGAIAMEEPTISYGL